MTIEEKEAMKSFKEENDNDLSRFDDFNSYSKFKIKREKTILFSKPLKRIGLIEDYKWFTLEELKAINKKVEELEWLDE